MGVGITASRLATAAIVSLTLAASPVLAQATYSVRNDTGRAFSCGLRHERRSTIERFVIRSGTEWRQQGSGQGDRVLFCDSWKFTQRWVMRPGIAYVLANDPHSGLVTLRSASAR